jgi:hypothetical protein
VRDNLPMFLAHLPVNHHLRPLYRVVAALTGLYLLVFGVLGLIEASGLDAFAREGLPRVLGQTVNPAYAVLSIVLGGVTVLATVVGRNVDHYVDHWIGLLMLIIGLFELSFQRTDANFLGFSMTNCIVVFVLGLILATAGMYAKIGPTEEPAPAEHPARQPAAR